MSSFVILHLQFALTFWSCYRTSQVNTEDVIKLPTKAKVVRVVDPNDERPLPTKYVWGVQSSSSRMLVIQCGL